jgi:hypothetical protein
MKIYKITGADQDQKRCVAISATSEQMARVQAKGYGITAESITNISRILKVVIVESELPTSKLPSEVMDMVRAWQWHNIKRGCSDPWHYGFDAATNGYPREEMPLLCQRGWDMAQKGQVKVNKDGLTDAERIAHNKPLRDEIIALCERHKIVIMHMTRAAGICSTAFTGRKLATTQPFVYRRNHEKAMAYFEKLDQANGWQAMEPVPMNLKVK